MGRFCFVSKSFFLLLVVFYIGLCFAQKCNDLEIIGHMDPKHCNNTNKEYYEKSDDCIEKCVKKGVLGKPCSVKKKCAPGLICSETNICILDDNSCAKYDFIDEEKKPIWTPTCLNDGSYAPKQCKGGSAGRCFCYDAFGKRIFGEEWFRDSKDMTCACSRHRAELERAGRTNVTLHCDSLGNYEPLQCDAEMCWCTEPKTGEVLSPVVPQYMMEILHCFDPKQIGEQYLRQCESQLFAQTKIIEKLKTHGAKQVSFKFLLCDYDGSYGRYGYRENNIVACTNRDGKQSGAWAAEVTPALPIESFNCNCARDTILFGGLGMEMTLSCEANGSYKKIQGSSGQYFCVDKDGYRTSNFSSSEPKDCPL